MRQACGKAPARPSGAATRWVNPALLEYHHGIRIEWGDTQLVPDLADDVCFESTRATLGGGKSASPKDRGLGLEFGGIGGLRYDRATAPQATGPQDMSRHGFTVVCDVVARVGTLPGPEAWR
ncbi:MAG: hypothetical protein ACE5G2_03795 [Candidatus Krumholzibacteriia bacterium]